MPHLFLLWFLWFLGSTNFGFCFSSFLSCFSYTINFFDMFLVSWGKLVLLYTSPFEMLLLCPIGFGSALSFDISLSFVSKFCFFFPLWFIQWSIGWLVAYHLASMWQHGKECTCQWLIQEDADSIPESERSSGVGNDNLLQYSCLENSMYRGAWWTTVHGDGSVG